MLVDFGDGKLLDCLTPTVALASDGLNVVVGDEVSGLGRPPGWPKLPVLAGRLGPTLGFFQ